MRYNQFNQPIGESLEAFNLPSNPTVNILNGRYCRLEKLAVQHIDDLYNHFSLDDDVPNWTYLTEEPLKDKGQFKQYINNQINSRDPYFMAIIDQDTNEALGELALLRINPIDASIEVGHIHFSNVLKQTRIATEAHYLLANYVFEVLGYRRYEWKCDDFNQASKNSAKRLGFTYEGTFRQHKIYKKRNRNTAWFSMLNREWPSIKQQYERWLSPNNFDSKGRQYESLNIQ
ncbi:GNAT family protein [Staphylococcus kloosii]|uniref:GNAT family N-acetyltransferase n=1 Tax=Staphylococcus kloosii TaxID=29384 RepID=UPI0028A37217|nr:GNAT family protein [Staphylococcus kloosii]MDT3959577.1 GNAT family protein [Staphylococcus kloosii]